MFNKVLNSTTKKSEISEQFWNRDIPNSESMYNHELYHLIKINKPNNEEFYTDYILEQDSHSVSDYPVIIHKLVP